MNLIKAWKGWRQYCRLDDAFKKVVFYAESGQDWHHFEPLIRELLVRHEQKITYVSSDRNDPGLALQHDNYHSVFIPPGLFLIVHFQIQKAGVVVMTMMDLGNLQLKKSLHGVHYVYLFHSMGSTHMVDHANSYDAYDSLFCVGPHHLAELRKREELAGIGPRQLFEFGYPRLEQLRQEAALMKPARSPDRSPTVLVAPTWGEDSILNRCGAKLIHILLDNGFRVIMRPHYHTRRLTPERIEHLLGLFAAHPLFESMEQMADNDTLTRSDVLISDWSAMAIEYALGLCKPVIFIDLPRRIRNPEWKAFELEPLESSIRNKVGRIVSPKELEQIPDTIRELLARPPLTAEAVQTLEGQLVFNPGQSVSLGAAEIVRLANTVSRSGEPAVDES